MLAIIPARGGSKGVLKKNIQTLGGKPLIYWTIEAAMKAESITRVILSTDDKEIAVIAKKYGAKVPFLRSEKNANDFATTVDVILEVLDSYKRQAKSFDNICCIYPTAPFVSIKKLNKSFDILKSKALDSVFPVIKYGFPVQRSMRIFQGDFIRMTQPGNMNKRSQDLEPTFHDAGQFYWLKTNKFLLQKKLWTNSTGFIVVSELEAQDIDTETDWKIAELKYKMMIGGL